jgi:hypothetical protein
MKRRKSRGKKTLDLGLKSQSRISMIKSRLSYGRRRQMFRGPMLRKCPTCNGNIEEEAFAVHRERCIKRRCVMEMSTSRFSRSLAGFVLILLTFLSNASLEIDINLVESAIRPSTIGKKNWLAAWAAARRSSADLDCAA